MTASAGIAALGPDVTIRTTRDSEGLVLELSSPRVDDALQVGLTLPDIIRHRCARLGEAITRALGPFQSRRTASPSEAAHILDEIAQAGRIFLGGVLRDPKIAYGLLCNYLARACHGYNLPRTRIPVVHVVASCEDFFPWELLPLFQPAAKIEARDQSELEDACRVFPGFSTIVERRHTGWPETKAYLDGWNFIPVRMVYNAEYDGVHAELGFLQGQHRIRLEGPYPRCATDSREPSLAHQLSDPRLGIDGSIREYADEIVHISCHCEAPVGQSSDGFELHLADDQNGKVIVKLNDLINELMFRWQDSYANSISEAQMPFVFLNACGTSALDPLTAASFLKPFYDNRNRCIVATCTNVTDRMASDVSRWFYGELWSGATVGDALHYAKWRLLQDRGNPLGILYSVHTLASLRIQPVPGMDIYQTVSTSGGM